MKINGITANQPKTTLVVLQRGETLLPFRFQAVTDDSSFVALNPRPIPPRKFLQKDGITVDNVEDPNYKKKFAEWAGRREDWMFLQSIKPSNIEWDTVDLSDSTTWKNWRADLREAGFHTSEINTIFEAFLEANIVTDEMLEKARKSFLQSLAEVGNPAPQSSGDSEPESSSSGEPVTD